MKDKSKAIGISLMAVILLVVSQIAAELLASVFVVAGIPMGICNTVAGLVYLYFAWFLLKLFLEKIMHLKSEDYGISAFSVKPKWMVVALLLPLAVIGSYVVLFPGEYVASGADSGKIFEILSAGIFFTGIGSGFVEEMVFRGIIFHALEKAWNRKMAVIIPSVLFGVVHILGMNFSVGSCLLVILAGTAVGIMFSLITIESGSVWCNGLIHALWNIIIIGGGLHIGDKAHADAVISYVLHTKSFAVTGGDFGIESSVISLIGYMLVSVMAYLMIRNRSSRKEKESVSHQDTPAAEAE
ncbi:MAG: CPBP family intramembrane metalloprotease [Clostridia bacterium]|nr:CPBP family intramembrane metalloprotease [Clostridia bacterium]